MSVRRLSSRLALVVVILSIQVLLVGCAPSDVLPTPTATNTPEVINTLAPEATATVSYEESLDASKYDNVFVYTIEEQDNDRRSLLHVSYPVTEQQAINARLEALAQEFIDEFRTVAAEQEELYQAHLRDTGEKAVSTGAHYTQHFDVVRANSRLISCVIEQYRSMGNTGSTDLTA